MPRALPIGHLLVERGVVERDTVEEAAAAAPAGHGRLCSQLLETGKASEGDLAAGLGELLGLPGVDLSRSVLDLAAVDLVPRPVAEQDLLLPLSLTGGRVHLAVDSPQRAARSIDEVRFVSGREVSVYVAVLSALEQAIGAAYDARQRGERSWSGGAAPAGDAPVLAERGPLPRGPAGPPEEVVHAVTVSPPRARRVLVVDDEAAIRLLAQRALEGRGHAVVTAADGEEALRALAADRFDLVLLDAMLPRLHGFEVARRIRSGAATRSLPVIIMSALYRGWRFAQDAKASYGAQDYVEKPFRVDDLLRRVDAVLAAGSPAPGDAGAALPHVARGRAALQAGQVAEAVAAFQLAVAADAFSAEAHHGLGEALRLQGDAYAAMSELERAAELRPELLEALRMLAALYQQKGFRAKAAEALERAVAAAPDARTRDLLRRELLRFI